MTSAHIVRSFAVLAAVVALAAPAVAQPAALTIESAKVALSGTSNVHDYTASTTNVRLTRVVLGPGLAVPAPWDEVQKAGGLAGFDITIAAATLSCPRDGVDKNMHKALKVESHPDITFSLTRLEGSPGALTATGQLRIAGVAREVTLPLTTTATGRNLAVSGAIDVQMPDYGIKPPTAMLGVVRASPKVRVTFDLVLAPGTT